MAIRDAQVVVDSLHPDKPGQFRVVADASSGFTAGHVSVSVGGPAKYDASKGAIIAGLAVNHRR